MIAGDFARFMEEVHGHPPFPWQSEAVAEILRTGTWPSLVDVPTGLGKTSMLDVAVFILAMSAGGDAPSGLGDAGFSSSWIGASSSTRPKHTAGAWPRPWRQLLQEACRRRSPAGFVD